MNFNLNSDSYNDTEIEKLMHLSVPYTTNDIIKATQTLKTTIGKMMGSYLMERMIDGKQFYVEIPEFNLIVPYRLN